MVALRVSGAPELVQIPWHRPGRAHDHVLGFREGVDGPDDLALAWQGTVPQRVEALDLPIPLLVRAGVLLPVGVLHLVTGERLAERSEEHTSELQSRQYLVCRLLLEKKKKQIIHRKTAI